MSPHPVSVVERHRPSEQESTDEKKDVSRIVEADVFDGSKVVDDEDHIIVTGADAAEHLLSLRDDFDLSLTLRSFIFGTLLSGAQAAMNQIGKVSGIYRVECLLTNSSDRFKSLSVPC
jgi:hypothetical protein